MLRHLHCFYTQQGDPFFFKFLFIEPPRRPAWVTFLLPSHFCSLFALLIRSPQPPSWMLQPVYSPTTLPVSLFCLCIFFFTVALTIFWDIIYIAYFLCFLLLLVFCYIVNIMRVEVFVLFIQCCIPSAQNSACDLIHTL